MAESMLSRLDMGCEPQGDDQAGNDQCGCVVWRDEERRCELWRVQGTDRLRLFEGETLITEEPVLHGALWAQVLALRTWTPRRRRDLSFRRP